MYFSGGIMGRYISVFFIIMFWFIYTTFSAERWLFYDWNEYNLRYCSDPKSAKSWWEDHQDKMQEISIKLYWTRTIKVFLPIVDADSIEDSHDIIDRTEKHKINTINSQLLSQILDKYICSNEWIFAVRDVIRQELVSWVKMNMRDVIEWIFRVSDLKIITWEDKDTKKKQYMEVPLWQDVDVTYKSRKINLKWIYAPAIRKMMLPDSNFKWSTLQWRQQDALYKRGLYTFIIWPREWGKSLVSAMITAQWILKEISNPTVEQLRWIQILYYWQSNDSNKRYYKYVKWLLQKISKNWNFIKFSDAAQTIQVFDGDISREIQFISQLSEAKGRWERPSLIIIDEAARIDEEVWKIAIGTTWVPIICISTVNYETRKNRFYDEFVKAEKQQRTYEPIDELIDDIWSKYKLDWEIQWGIERWVFARARDEFYERRPRVALRYTIDDIEPTLMSEAQKKLKIENASQQWERFVMAEYYWFYVDDVDVFSYDGLMVSETPNTYDFITVWYDPAQDYDFAWCTVVWVKEWICYILESKRLSSDPVLQLRELKEIREKYKSYITWDRKYVNLWADITRWDWDLVIIEDRWIFVDYPIKFTAGKWISYNGRIHRPWKLYIIENIIRDQFFFKNNIKFPEYLAWDNWLLDEIASFRRVPTQSWQYTYKWVKSKDDLVFSMMIALYVAYCEWLRDEYLRGDEEKQSRVWKLSDLVPKETNEVYNDMVAFWF